MTKATSTYFLNDNFIPGALIVSIADSLIWAVPKLQGAFVVCCAHRWLTHPLCANVMILIFQREILILGLGNTHDLQEEPNSCANQTSCITHNPQARTLVAVAFFLRSHCLWFFILGPAHRISRSFASPWPLFHFWQFHSLFFLPTTSCVCLFLTVPSAVFGNQSLATSRLICHGYFIATKSSPYGYHSTSPNKILHCTPCPAADTQSSSARECRLQFDL